jgi:hypothetical protein
MPLSDFHPKKDTVLDDTNACLKRNIVPEKSTNEHQETNSSKNKDDNFNSDTYLAGTSECSKRKSNIVAKKTTSESGEINLSKKNEENFKSTFYWMTPTIVRRATLFLKSQQLSLKKQSHPGKKMKTLNQQFLKYILNHLTHRMCILLCFLMMILCRPTFRKYPCILFCINLTF